MFTFITKRPFWVNLLAAMALAFLLIFLFLQMLTWITKHGEHLTVPSVLKVKTGDAVKQLEKQGFDVTIQDSVYIDSLPKGVVIKQLPDPNSTVKVNRTVFLTVNCQVPPLIVMPKLEGLTLNFALNVLERAHLKLQDTIFKPDFMRGSVLEQQINGSKVAAGSKVRWGSAITLIVGRGLEEEQIIVPDFIGQTYGAAKTGLDSMGISIGAILAYDGVNIQDTMSAFIVRQSPERYTEDKRPRYISSGQIMDFWLSPVMINLKDSVNNKTSTKEDKQ